MDNIAFLNSINRGVVAPVYLFYGTEKLLMDNSLEKLKTKLLSPELESFNFTKVDGDKVSLGSIIDLANTMPVFAEKRIVVVDNAEFFATSKGTEENSSCDLLLKYLENPNVGCCLVFRIARKADKRKKIFKAVMEKGQALEFASLNGESLRRWIKTFLKKKGKALEPRAFNYLALLAVEGLETMVNELEKLSLYAGDDPNITLAMVEEVVTKNSEINIFKLIDSIAERKGERALALMQASLSMGEAPMKLLSLLVRQYRLILLVKDMMSQGFSEKQVLEKLKDQAKLKVQPFVLRRVLSQGRNLTVEQLVISLEKLLETEVYLKSGGGEPAELMEDLVIGLCYNHQLDIRS